MLVHFAVFSHIFCISHLIFFFRRKIFIWFFIFLLFLLRIFQVRLICWWILIGWGLLQIYLLDLICRWLLVWIFFILFFILFNFFIIIIRFIQINMRLTLSRSWWLTRNNTSKGHRIYSLNLRFSCGAWLIHIVCLTSIDLITFMFNIIWSFWWNLLLIKLTIFSFFLTFFYLIC